MVAGIDVVGTEVLLASVHLHSHGGPDERAEELAAVIGALDRRAAGGPAVIGGDLNTHTWAEDLQDVGALTAASAPIPSDSSIPSPTNRSSMSPAAGDSSGKPRTLRA